MDCDLHPFSSALATTSIALTLVILATGVGYLRSPRRLRGKPWAFISGLFVLWLVIASPLSSMDHRLLTFHMLQHLLSMTIAAPLILLGLPGLAIPRRLASPIGCWLIGTGVVILWHVPTAHELGMRSEAWHLIQHLTFFGAGLLFWWPVLTRAPGKLRASSVPIYLFLATLPCDALSAFLTFCGRVVYRSHASLPAMSALSPLQDQELAGALMWFWVTIAYLVPAVTITVRMLSPARDSDGVGQENGRGAQNPSLAMCVAPGLTLRDAGHASCSRAGP